MSPEQSLPILSDDEVSLEKLIQTALDPRWVADRVAHGCQDRTAGSDETAGEVWQADESSFGTRLHDLRWIDSFVEQIRPYVRVRLDDGVLIKMPMEVFQLSRSGLELLDQVLRGRKIVDVATDLGAAGSPERIYQVHTFFCDVRDLLGQRLGDGRGRPTTRISPYTGSFTRYPVLSEIAVTYRCNLACSFCYAGCGTADASPGNARRERHRHDWKFWRAWPWWPGRAGSRDPLRQK